MSWRFNPPPGWPVPSGAWLPPAGWVPGPDWPPAPPGWEFWVYTPARRPAPPPPHRRRPPVRIRGATPPPGSLDQPGPVARAIAAVIIALLSALSLAVGAGLHFDLH